MNIEEYSAIRPSYYNDSEISCIDGMVGAFGKDAVIEFCKINAFKYLWRLGQKDAEEQEVGKIKWYLDKYLELKHPDKVAVEDGLSHLFDNIPSINTASNKTISREDLLKKGLTIREAENILEDDGKNT